MSMSSSPGTVLSADAGQLTERIAQDRAYVQALRDGDDSGDPRLGPSAYGKDFLPSVHEGQLSVRTPTSFDAQLAKRLNDSADRDPGSAT